eukprot:CAMPEP_0194328444 /NCGR_PEP_ID=MMETSP0171-20130528/44873_1 /TAXON_ID=218684 /ORGANISM="Corethron pennatum, Strain L29A3" /LENGTH=244 /DNA_ID=CAMNT_0039088805 /DNA_START=10 /DNA_END=744 /DNA_ORIENTATION=-
MMNSFTNTNNKNISQNDSNDNNDDDVIIRTYKSKDLSQVQNLFIDGMKHNNSTGIYVKDSLSSDLSSIEQTYFTSGSGRGTFFVMEEKRQSINDDGGNDCHDGYGRIIGIVGLQDLYNQLPSASEVAVTTTTTTTPTEKDHNKQEERNEIPPPTLKNYNNTCALRRMSIHSSHRRKGRGRQLLQTCISHAKKKGFDGIVLYTGGWMEAAISFYVSMGFEEMGRADYVLPDGTIIIAAKLELMFV